MTQALSLDPFATYLQYDPRWQAKPLPVTDDFWPALQEGRLTVDGALVAAYRFDASMTHWERHPAGDELVMVLSGALDLVVERGAGEERTLLPAGRLGVVPRGLWHRFDVVAPATALFFTPGEGTEHRAG